MNQNKKKILHKAGLKKNFKKENKNCILHLFSIDNHHVIMRLDQK